MNSRKKILILYNKLFHYRIPIFNILAKKYDITVVYSYETSSEILSQCEFQTQYIPIFRLWKFVIHKRNIYSYCHNFDVVIAYGEKTWLSYAFLSLCKRSFKLLFWTIGAPASYDRHYGEACKLHYYLTDFFDKRADGLIFYSDVPIQMYKNRGVEKQNFFVANNTVKVRKTKVNPLIKNQILFIGSLYLEKGLPVLLDAYKKVYEQNQSIPNLVVVGGGDQLETIKEWVVRSELSSKVELLGPIYEEGKKAELFSKSIACISPLQAGLSVLESMGYGVPFITMEDAITGGEIFNIKHNVNGLLLAGKEEFEKVLLEMIENKEKFIEYGINAYRHYWDYRKPEDMTKGLCEAIENS